MAVPVDVDEKVWIIGVSGAVKQLTIQSWVYYAESKIFTC